MKSTTNGLNKAEKVLLFLYEFGNGSREKIRYEDIVAGLFQKYPHDFHLKGYPQYPDSGDLIHKPLYEFKKKGYVNASSKVFSLTERGAELAEQLAKRGRPGHAESSDRLARSTETEVVRVKALDGFGLFSEGRKEKLSDGDFYSYLGVTVRTPKNAFKGRLETMRKVAAELRSRPNEVLSTTIVAYHDFLTAKHDEIIEYFTRE